MTDFLLELRSEEIPARMQDRARDDLARLFAAEIAKAGLVAESVTTYATPRRLALIARGLPLETAAVAEEFKGPRTSAPAQALEGFLRKTGLAQEQLEDRDGVWFAVVEKAGRATTDVLAEAVPAIVRAFPWPKSMRWGAASSTTESLRWVRPLQGIVAILGEALVPCVVDGIESGFVTKGHRFHHKGEITIGGAHNYVAKLRAAHVIVDQDERRGIIRDGARALCAERGLAWISDEALVAENAGLTEWPVPLLGDFDPAFLEVPPEVVRLTLGVNQKYFVASSLPLSLRDAAGSPSADGRGNPPRDGEVARSDGGGSPPQAMLDDESPLRPLRGHLPASGEDFSLAPAFICTANIAASDGGAAIVAGNRKVLAARLSDARFFWEQDKKTPLAVHAEKLSRITFHEKLGTVADKVERVAKLARWLVEEGIVGSSLPFPSAGGRGESSPERGGGREADGGGSPPSTEAENESPLRPLRGHLPASGEDVFDPPRDGEVARSDGGGLRPSTVAETESPLRPLRGHLPAGGEDRASLADLAEQAARLCKADLVTEMVGEFPELQGVMGGYYARAEGLPDAVADAIRDHYKPVGAGDAVPTAPVTVAVSLADKLDTLVSFFSVDLRPTGSKDPFALRRAGLGIIALATANNLRFDLASYIEPMVLEAFLRQPDDGGMAVGSMARKMLIRELLDKNWIDPFSGCYDGDDESLVQEQIELLRPAVSAVDTTQFAVSAFMAERLAAQQKANGVSLDLIYAVFDVGDANFVRLLARVKALQAFVGTADGVNLLAGYKRAANILKKEGGAPLPFRGGVGGGASQPDAALADTPHPNPSPEGEGLYEPAEAALIAALDVAEPAAAAAVAGERFEEAMAALASLRAPIDAFFESVTVNDADPVKRAARLGLLARLTAAVNGIADFSKIEG